jgi:hypothetical protein
LLHPGRVTARIFVLLTTVVLLTSRIMLLVHEFGGHGAPASIFGGRVTGWYLFLFAGGRVSYEIADLDVARRLVIGLGGIALELGLGGIAVLLAEKLRSRRAGGLVAFVALASGTVVVGHGAVYLARGVHYGFGDGALLAQVLGGWRWLAVLGASTLAVAMALFAGRRLVVVPASLLAGSPARIAAVTLLMFACAGLVHGGLAWAEVRWFPDPAWVAIMEDASAAAARAELARRLAEARLRGQAPPPPVEQRRMLDDLERERRPWPLDPVLGTAVLAALAASVVRGARESRRTDADLAAAPSWRTIGVLAAALLLAIAVILVLRRVGAHA